MIYKYQYKTLAERDKLLDENGDKFLVEEQNIIEGNFLIFSDIEPKEPEQAFPPEYLLNVEMKKLNEKVAEQDAVIEELLFSIIPNLM